MLEGKIRMSRLWDRSGEFQLNDLETELKAEIEILKDREKMIKNTISIYEKSKFELIDLRETKMRDALLRINIESNMLKELEKIIYE